MVKARWCAGTGHGPAAGPGAGQHPLPAARPRPERGAAGGQQRARRRGGLQPRPQTRHPPPGVDPPRYPLLLQVPGHKLFHHI